MTVLCFGELLLRLSAPGRELLLQGDRLDVRVGGAEANVAVGLAHLGHATRLASAVPDNPLGRGAVAAVRGYGVDCAPVAFRPGRMGLYFMSVGAGVRASDIVYDRAGSSFATAPADAWDWDALLRGCTRLHLSGITPALGPAPAAAAVAAAEAACARGIAVSFDGNYRSSLWQAWDGDPRPVLRHVVACADLLFGDHRDIALLLGDDAAGEGDARDRAAADAAFAAFPRLRLIAATTRVVEDSDRHRLSARIDTRGGTARAAEVAVSGIVDRIGTGDAFAAGVLHAVLGGRDAQVAAEWGLALAALKHSLPGDASLFGQADIDAYLAGRRDVRR